MNKSTYIVRYETDKYKYTCAVNVAPSGDRKRDIDKAVAHMRGQANWLGLRRITSVTGPVTLYQAD